MKETKKPSKNESIVVLTTPSNEKNDLIIKYKKTKYSKLNAAKRCDNWNLFLKVLSFILNLGMCVLSFVSIIFGYYLIGVFVALLSVIVFATSLFVTNLNFNSSAKQHRETMAKIDNIVTRLSSNEITEHDAEKEYELLMSSCLPHQEIDYIKYKHEYPEEFWRDDFSATKKVSYQKEIKDAHKKYYEYCVKIFLLKSVVTGFIYPIYWTLCIFVSWIIRKIKSKKDEIKS